MQTRHDRVQAYHFSTGRLASAVRASRSVVMCAEKKIAPKTGCAAPGRASETAGDTFLPGSSLGLNIPASGSRLAS